MKRYKTYVAVILLVIAAGSLSGCVTGKFDWKWLIGTSTKDVEDARKDAITKVFDLDYDTAYTKVRDAIKNIKIKETSTYAIKGATRDISIYAGSKAQKMIALYYININTTPVGIFFKDIDNAHTEIAVSSQSPSAKAFISGQIFSALEKK